MFRFICSVVMLAFLMQAVVPPPSNSSIEATFYKGVIAPAKAGERTTPTRSVYRDLLLLVARPGPRCEDRFGPVLRPTESCGKWMAGERQVPAPPSRREPKPLIFATQWGKASWYGPGFHGRPTAECRKGKCKRFDMNDPGAIAHRELPIGTPVLITAENGRQIRAVVKDRGPYARVHERIADLSYAAAQRLGFRPGTPYDRGVMNVRIDVLTPLS